MIAAHNLRAEKKFGQNFLLDLNITAKIARAAGDLSGTNVFEIGPGPGGLTRSLLAAGAQKVVAIEFDPRAVVALEGLKQAAGGRLSVLHADALSCDLAAVAPAPRAIVANLPYNISTVLLVSWLAQLAADPHCYDRFILMFQKEVAERLCAPPGNKTYGRLSVLAQWLCRVEPLFDLPPSVFTPPPKVISTVVRLTPRRDEAAPQPSFTTVEKLTAAAFGQRRKMLRATLKPWPGLLEKAGIDGNLRAEQLAAADFIRMARVLETLNP